MVTLMSEPRTAATPSGVSTSKPPSPAEPKSTTKILPTASCRLVTGSLESPATSATVNSESPATRVTVPSVNLMVASELGWVRI